jgi:hypothetical protein
MKLFTLYGLARWMPVSKDRRLAWQRKALDREYKRDLAAAGKDADALDVVHGSYHWDFRILDEEIDTHYAIRLARKASRLHVPTPSFEDKECWKRSENTGDWYMSDEGCRRVRELIRAERRGQWELISRWVPIIGAIAAMIAAAAIVYTAFHPKK